ncbi:hypothetical protein [Dactylosporangium sp. NPDC051484]|uniref:hypothetical protein n=1 Tax=Dactylosporangium sp. NPDC051484 TaxID=3154942 RepID=UPI00344BFF33
MSAFRVSRALPGGGTAVTRWRAARYAWRRAALAALPTGGGRLALSGHGGGALVGPASDGQGDDAPLEGLALAGRDPPAPAGFGSGAGSIVVAADQFLGLPL